MRKMSNTCVPGIAVLLLSVVACADIDSSEDPLESTVESALRPPTGGGSASSQPTHPTSCWFNQSRWWCANHVATMYASDWTPVDTLRTSPSWFNCRAEGGFSGAGPHPNRWLWTKGDVHGAWGWVKDSAVGNDTNVLPRC